MSDISPPNLPRRRNHIAVRATAPEMAFHLPPRFCVGEVAVAASVLDEMSLRRIRTPSALEHPASHCPGNTGFGGWFTAQYACQSKLRMPKRPFN
jgi:hypothetical protein